jgi:hypothetical protein
MRMAIERRIAESLCNGALPPNTHAHALALFYAATIQGMSSCHFRRLSGWPSTVVKQPRGGCNTRRTGFNNSSEEHPMLVIV